jgi:NAD(P)-dependent dehydrogenase (short-subunit alcohol dehydrogenase family)
MELRLSGSKVLVTGGSRGIGRAIAETFAEEGCRLWIASRSAADLEKARKDIAAKHQANVVTVTIDMGSAGAAAKLAAETGDVDILINNAGVIPRGELLDLNEAKWREAWELKVFGYINLTREYFGRMKARGRGVIINVIGLAAEKLDDRYIAGSSGNAALVAFTRALGSYSIDHGVRVLGINPGWTETDRSTKSLRGRAEAELGDAGRWNELIATTMPGGRLLTPAEIADVVVFAASERAGGISGHVITVDAGMAARSYR